MTWVCLVRLVVCLAAVLLKVGAGLKHTFSHSPVSWSLIAIVAWIAEVTWHNSVRDKPRNASRKKTEAKWPLDLFRAGRRTQCVVPTSVSIRGSRTRSHLPGAPSNGRKYRIAGVHRLERLDQDR